MTRQVVKELLPILTAYADGKTIQLRTTEGWKDIAADNWIPALPPRSYRIKPDPLECWVCVDEDGRMRDGWMVVEKPINSNYRKFREVVEG